MSNIARILIQSDYYRYYGNQKLRLKLVAIRNPSLHYIKIFRLANWYSKKQSFLGIYFRIRLNFLSRRLHIQIPFPTRIGFGLYIVHYGRLIIAPSAVIGNNCTLFTGITIGSEARGKRYGAPTIGDKVWIGANSTIVGKVMIGNNVLIAPNSYINFDVPSNSIVIGNPAKVYPNDNATENYITNLWSE